MQKQLDALTSQFHGFSSPASVAALTHPNDPTLAADFAHAASTTSVPPKSTLRAAASPTPKTVRFQDAPPAPDEDDHIAASLFNRPYRDDPDDTAGYPQRSGQPGQHAAARLPLRGAARQDEQLDELGASIGRQRELSIRIGDELDTHVAMLEESEAIADRHQSRLDRAARQMGRVAKSAGENKQMVAIVVLIVILILLIALLK